MRPLSPLLLVLALAGAAVAQPRPSKPSPPPATEPTPPPPHSAPAPTAPAPAPAPPDPSAQHQAELTALRAELSQVMDALVQARTRVAVLGKALFKTRVRVELDNRAAPDQTAVRVALWLDGAPIFSGDG